MKIKIKSKNSALPNCWKQAGASFDDWQELKSGKEISVKSIPSSIKSLVLEQTKVKGDK
tara:strand:+ start:1384 stop:1560 length:177 start_codon:yes stop_codon:yes gene_type:complete